MRYLRGARGRTDGRRFLRFVTTVAVGGVAVGVMALILALSIVRGFSREIEAKIIGFGAHVQVESMADTPIDGAAALGDSLSAIPGVTSASPEVIEFALLRKSSKDIDGVGLWGSEALPPYLSEHIVAGTPDFERGDSGLPGMVIGSKLARLLNSGVGDFVTVYSMKNAGRSGMSNAGLPRVKQFVVSGIYETSFANFDELYVFCDIDIARALLQYGPDQVTRFDLTLADISGARESARFINERWGYPIVARTIFEVYHSYFAWVKLQQGIIPIVIGVIILVAAFNIVGTLLMLALEKTREMGILISMGASARLLRRLYLWLGLLIGGFGTVIGESMALVLAWLQIRYGIIPLPEEAYFMKQAPVELEMLDFVLVGAIALLLCTVAAYIPARVASRIEPIRAIHFH